MRKEKTPSKEVQEWADSLEHAFKSQHGVNISSKDYDDIIKLAGVICLLPKEERHKLFWVINLLLVNSKRKKYLSETVQVLPKNSEELINFHLCIRSYERLARKGYFQSFSKGKYSKGKFNPVNVIKAFKQIGDNYKQYLTFYKDHFFTYPAIVFSDRGIKEASKKLRGMTGSYAEENKGYTKEIEESLETYEA